MLLLVLQIVFVLFHGQAEVERGFSANKAMLQTNMKEVTVVAHRHVKGHLKANELVVSDMEIPRELCKSVSCGSSGYRVYLQEQCKVQEDRKRKKREDVYKERLGMLVKEKEDKEKF